MFTFYHSEKGEMSYRGSLLTCGCLSLLIYTMELVIPYNSEDKNYLLKIVVFYLIKIIETEINVLCLHKHVCMLQLECMDAHLSQKGAHWIL